MNDRYGPWTVHTHRECPVPPDTMVQVQLRNMTQMDAEEATSRADNWKWGLASPDGYAIAYYRVLLEPEWVRICHLAGDMLLPPIDVPMIDGKPDFSRQPKWEEV